MTNALVLGGGGVTGVAWETGVLKALRDSGVDVTGADLVVGTSAGSIVGAQLTTGFDLDGLFDAQLAPATTAPAADVSKFLGFLATLAVEVDLTPEQLRSRIGAMALEATYPDEASQLETIMAGLLVREWPDRRLLITAVDAANGAFVTWERESGVALPLAVASSCAVPGVFPPVEIRGRYYMDGGMRSITNADLAAGHEHVVVIAPTGARPRGVPDPLAALPADSAVLRWARSLDGEVEALRSAGSAVHVVVPDAAAMEAIGLDLLDQRRREPAARAGLAQAASDAEWLTVALRARPV